MRRPLMGSLADWTRTKNIWAWEYLSRNLQKFEKLREKTGAEVETEENIQGLSGNNKRRDIHKGQHQEEKREQKNREYAQLNAKILQN